jgi:hypothetical protein
MSSYLFSCIHCKDKIMGKNSYYEGELDENGKAHGSGKLKYANGSEYVGQFVDGKRHGQGMIKFAYGDKYEGEFKDDKRDGKGTFKKADGSVVYEGEYKDEKIDGKGTYKWADGSVYEGEYKGGKIDGKGTYTRASGSVYEGEYKGGKKDGKGKLKMVDDGSVYEGEFKDNKRDGKGTFKMVDGSVYEGEFKDGRYNGAGTLRESNGILFKTIYNQGNLVSRKRCVSSGDITAIYGALSSRPPDTNVDVCGFVPFYEYDTTCQLCSNEFLTDIYTMNEDDKKRLPVLGSCNHVSCLGCVLKWQ